MHPFSKLILVFVCFFLGSFAHAAENLPAVSCILTDAAEDNSLTAKETFGTNTAMIFLLCTSDEIKPGQRLKAVWIAADTQGIAPANYKVYEKSFEAPNNMDEQKEWTIKYSLSKPYAGWPAGQYHVDLYADEYLLKSLKFTIESK